MSDKLPSKQAPTFFEQVVAMTPGVTHLECCIQCGTCAGSCPSNSAMDHTPRALFALIAAGIKEPVLKSNTYWYCASCYYCMVRCPQEVHITDLMYTLKRYAICEGFYNQPDSKSASAFSKIFIWNVENFGRSFELGLAAAYHLAYHPLALPSMAPLALGLMSRARMDIVPRRVKHMDSLKAILKKSKELEEEDLRELEVGTK